MKDPSLALTLGFTCIVFAAIAAYIPQVIGHISRRGRLKPPHAGLILVTRLWFALLALGCLTLLVLNLLRHP